MSSILTPVLVLVLESLMIQSMKLLMILASLLLLLKAKALAWLLTMLLLMSRFPPEVLARVLASLMWVW